VRCFDLNPAPAACSYEHTAAKREYWSVDLNQSQRTAVEHGVGDSRPAAPLLIIAGAGTGKTNTLAHRVARLVLNGTDPKRILLLTFSRRAARK